MHCKFNPLVYLLLARREHWPKILWIEISRWFVECFAKQRQIPKCPTMLWSHPKGPPSKGWPYSFPHLNIHPEPWFLLRVKPGSPHMTASWDRCGRLGNCWTSSCLVIFGGRIPLSWNLQRRGDNWHSLVEQHANLIKQHQIVSVAMALKTSGAMWFNTHMENPPKKKTHTYLKSYIYQISLFHTLSSFTKMISALQNSPSSALPHYRICSPASGVLFHCDCYMQPWAHLVWKFGESTSLSLGVQPLPRSNVIIYCTQGPC